MRASPAALIKTCAAVAALCAACDEIDDGGGAASESTVCSTVGTASWWNQAFTDQTGRFHVEMDVTPSVGNLDGTIGLSAGPATKWTSLAAIIRFNTNGYIDARSGSEYRADTQFHYDAGTSYHIRFDVDLKARTYSAWVQYPYTANHPYYAIGRDYPFRTEQAGATHLANIGAFVNPQTGPGALTICGWSTVADATTADGCTINTAGAGFANMNVQPSTTVQHVSLTATPKLANMDGVVGVTVDGASAYNDFAASLRFYTNGRVEARDGDTYRADTAIPYAAGQEFHIHFVIDLPSHTYSVYVQQDLDWIAVGRNYRFRPQQASATSLGMVSTIVASSSGRLDACNPIGGPNAKLVSARAGYWDVEPQADGGALMSDGASTLRLDARNVPVASNPVGGQVAADASGNIYVASIASGTLTLRAYTQTFGARWSTTLAVSDPDIADVIVNSDGHVAIALGTNHGDWTFAPTQVVRFDSGGRFLSTTNLFGGSTAIGMAKTYYAVAVPISGGVEVEVWGYGTNQLLRTRQFIGPIAISEIAIAPDGSVVIGGNLTGTSMDSMTFDGCTVAPSNFQSQEAPYWDAYIAAFGPDLFTRFCDRLTSNIRGIATDGTKIAVSYLTWTQLHYTDLLVYNTAGTVVQGSSEDAFVGYFGFPGSIALGASGQLYLNEDASLGGPADGGIQLLVTLAL